MRTSRRGPTSEKRPRQGQPKTAPGRSLPARAVPPHDDLDAAVAAAYGWPADLTDQEILERIVALNAARAAEEAKGKIRWLRPEFQNPSAPGGAPSPAPANANAARRKVAPPADQSRLALGLGKASGFPPPAPRSRAKPIWPKERPAQVEAVAAALRAASGPTTAAELAATFARGKKETVAEILKALVVLGRAHPGDKRGTYAAG